MKAFSALFQELDGTTRTGAKLEALERYFRSADPADAAWALALLLGKRRRSCRPRSMPCGSSARR